MKRLLIVAVASTVAGFAIAGEDDAATETQNRIVRSFADGHATVVMALPIEHSADRAWSLISDFDNMDVAVDIAVNVTYDGDENGGIRTIFLKPDLGGGSVSEQIYEIDPALRSLKYILTDFGDSPFAHYEGYMKVSSVGKKKSVIYYRATIFPTTISESDAADFAVRNMLGFQKRLNELL